MLILRDIKALFQADDPWLRALLARRTKDILDNVDDDYHLHELVTFVVVGPGDSREALDRELGFPLDAFETLEEHAGYYEIVYVVSDDGYGYEVFVPKRGPDLDAELLAFCAQRAVPSPDSPP
jgi:hypothetical protein